MTNSQLKNHHSWFFILVSNVALWLGLWGALELGLRGLILLPFIGSQPFLLCQLPQGFVFIGTAWIILLAHAFWRTYYPQNSERFSGIKFKGVPIQLFDNLHPWDLQNRVFFAAIVLFGIVVLLLGQSAIFPFRAIASSPVIQGFSASMDGASIPLRAGNVLEVEPGHLVLVQAIVLGTLQPNCTWSAISGSLQAADQCSAVYSLPFTNDRDILTVKVQSTCGSVEVSSGIHVNVIPSKP